MLCVGFGIGITKADIFPAVASRGAGQVILVSVVACRKMTVQPNVREEHNRTMSHVLEDRTCVLD